MKRHLHCLECDTPLDEEEQMVGYCEDCDMDLWDDDEFGLDDSYLTEEDE